MLQLFTFDNFQFNHSVRESPLFITWKVSLSNIVLMNIEMSLARLLQRLHLQKESLFLFLHYQIIYEFILILQIINLQSNFSQNFPYAHVSIQAPGVLQMCPLTSLVKYFGLAMTTAPSRGVQS